MRRVMAVLMLLCAGCVNRTENLDFHTTASVELEIPEMVVAYGQEEGRSAKNDSGDSKTIQHKYIDSTSVVTSDGVPSAYSADNGSVSPQNNTSKDQISEAVFYIFNDKDLLVSKNVFMGPENYKLEFRKNGSYSVYVLCNISEFVELPESPTKGALESLVIPHSAVYGRLPFVGTAHVEVVSGEQPEIRIKLSRINSSIRVENRSADRMTLSKVTVNGLPSRGNIFSTGTEATGVTYTESAEAEIDAEGNAVVYSFFVPEAEMANIKIEAEATLADTDESARTVSPVAFLGSLEVGKQATAYIGYLESGDLNVGAPDNWGNVGMCEFSDGVVLQVVGGEFFGYNGTEALRAYSGGSVFSCMVRASDGVATLQTVGTVDWVTIKDNIIMVSANPSATGRECQVSVNVGGRKAGVFYIVQGKAITFACGTLPIADGTLEMIGGVGSSAVVHTVTFDIDDEELKATEITPKNNGENGVSVEVDPSAKTLTCHFMPLVDASLVDAAGVSVPVEFVDINGTVQATLTLRQRPVRIAFNPARHDNISYDGGTVMAVVTVEGDDRWTVRNTTDQSDVKDNGLSLSWLPRPTGIFNSGGNLLLEAAPNTASSGRMAYVHVQSRYTISKPYIITQTPSYGIRTISSTGVWDADANTLKTYSKGQEYTVTFETETPLPDNIATAACDIEGIVAGAVTHTTGSSYTFTLTVPDSDNPDEEVSGKVDITAGDIVIGGFGVTRAYKPSFLSVNEEVWGGVKERPALKEADYRASVWDLNEFTSDNPNIAVNKLSDSKIEVTYAETLAYDSEPQTATVTMKLNGGNTVTYTTMQSPVSFAISDDDLARLTGLGNNASEVDVTVVTKADKTDTQWKVSSTSAAWLTTDPSAGGTETNASGTTLSVRVAENTGGDRTGSFVLESLNTTSPAYEVSQKGRFGVKVKSVTYNGKSALFAADTLKAFSTLCDYTFTVETENAVESGRLSVTGKTAGSAVTVKTQPGGTAPATSHTFVITVPKSTLTTESESRFEILADGNTAGEFTVVQAKTPSIKVSTPNVIGGSAAVGGSFVASVWDLKPSGYVTSSNTDMAIASPSTSGTFTVGMAATMDQTFAKRSATITLVGVTGNLATCTITQDKVLYAFNPTGLSFKYNETSTGKNVTVTSSNAGTISSGMTATSSQKWCTVSVSGNKVTVKVATAPTTASRSATVYVTYKGCKSNTFTVSQSGVPATVTIGGVTWSSFNVNTPGTLATSIPSALSGTREASHGKFYQWNRKVAWSTTSTISNWDATTPAGDYWEDVNNPCPSGFVVPTRAQWVALVNGCNATYYNSGSGWSASNYGYLTLTDKSNSSNTLEFPAVGYRRYTDCSLLSAGAWGDYWSSTQNSSAYAYGMNFNSSSVDPSNLSDKRNGLSVRCVRKVNVPTTVTIGGMEWMRYNTDTPGTIVKTLPSEVDGIRYASHGKFYQWDKKVAWSTTGTVSGWNTTASSATSWLSANNPCPSGFKVPSKEQWETLINGCTKEYKGGFSSSDYGYLVLTSGSNKLEFPAVGYRNSSDGGLDQAGTHGYYWSSTQGNPNGAYRMLLNSSSVGAKNYYSKLLGYSVRCIRQ